MRLDHVNIQARDQEAMRDFLVATLGLKVGYRPPFNFPGYWLYLGDQAIIHLQGHPSPGDDQNQRGWVDHLAFGPFDFDEQCAALDRAGVPYRTSGVPGMPLRQIFVAGPEAVKLELQCPAK
jgi:catechol 2,3-dioxygenase-like lactoylglutathione lyase family enzyme